jgi:selenocysteine-specific elongation factor
VADPAMIVATAGHIDHGKTTLIRALTGVDTDRLPQEKARGISIDLGFAYWQAPGGDEVIGFVDVPGHERFVRNMVAGVCGIDFVLLVVAADDGVMPQTVEHLQIVDLLSVRHGMAVITKIDRVPPQRVGQVAADVRSLLAATPLAGIDIVPVSAVDGRGLDAVHARLAGQAAQAVPPRQEGRRLRYAVDRSFVIPGSGTVVTGTVFSGTVTVGDPVTVSPAGLVARVRGIRQDRASVRHATAGQRCALNLGGVEVAQVRRGDWVLEPELHAPTQALDVRLRLLPTEAGSLRHWTPVHLHLGTADVSARVAVRRGASLQPGESALVRLETQRPLVAHHGDRFILRDQSGRRSVGGGRVVDPCPPQRRRAPHRPAQLAALEHDDPLQALQAMAACTPAGIDLAGFARSFALTAERTNELARRCGLVLLGKAPELAYPASQLERTAADMDAALRRFHAEQPRAGGIEVPALRRLCAPGWSADGFAALLRRQAQPLGLELKGSTVRSTRYASTLPANDLALWQRAQPRLDDAGFGGLRLPELAEALCVNEMLLADVLHKMVKLREGAFVSDDRFYTRRVLGHVAAQVGRLAREQPDGRFSAAQARDRLGVGRALAVQLLECLDRWGCTQRQGLLRVMRPDPHDLWSDDSGQGRAD